ncbi:MAG: helix-turn-helix domain-containing protein [Desulfobacterales bacterium]
MNPNLAEAERFIDEKETAKLLNVSIFTLRGQRHARRGLPFYKFGRSVRYKMSDILEHMSGLRVETR